MKDEIYPPPKPKPRTPPGGFPPPPSSGKRRTYMALSLVFAVLAFVINLSNNTNLITLKARPDTLPQGTAEINARLRNMSAMTVYCARVYTLERLDGEDWIAIAASGGEFDTPYFTLEKFSSLNLTFGKYGVFQPLEPGQYRIALEFYAPSAFLGSTHSGIFYAEFTVK